MDAPGGSRSGIQLRARGSPVRCSCAFTSPGVTSQSRASRTSAAARRDGAAHPVIDPSTGAEVARWVEATPAEIDAAVGAARRTFDEGVWRRMSLAGRAEVLEQVAQRLRDERERLAALEALDTGKAVGGAVIYDLYE